MFLLIEGDNGTGKDTLALELAKYGFDIVSYHESVKAQEAKAKRLSGENRISSFLEYNAICGELASAGEVNGIVIRYWISTLAAAYADKSPGYTTDFVIKTAQRLVGKMPKPDMVVYLDCDYNCRVDRITKRNNVNTTLKDDTSALRHERYKKIVPLILSASGYTYITIDNTNKSVEESVLEVMAYVDKQRTKNG